MMTTNLTPRQKAILTFVTQFIATHCYSPTIREITDGLGLPSTSHVVYILNRLQTDGYLTRQPAIARSIVLTSKGVTAMNDGDLSPIETEILTLIGHCLTRRQVAHRLHLSSAAIRGHEERIYKKIGVTSRTQAAIYAWRNGCVDPNEAWNTVKEQEWGTE